MKGVIEMKKFDINSFYIDDFFKYIEKKLKKKSKKKDSKKASVLKKEKDETVQSKKSVVDGPINIEIKI